MPGMAGVGKKPRLAGETTAGTGTETGIETGTETETETGIEETGTTEIGIATEVGGSETEIGKVIVVAEDEDKDGGRYDSSGILFIYTILLGWLTLCGEF